MVKAGEAQVQQVGAALEGGGVRAHLAVFVLWQDAAREIQRIAEAVQDALHTHPRFHILMRQRRARRAAAHHDLSPQWHACTLLVHNNNRLASVSAVH